MAAFWTSIAGTVQAAGLKQTDTTDTCVSVTEHKFVHLLTLSACLPCLPSLFCPAPTCTAAGIASFAQVSPLAAALWAPTQLWVSIAWKLNYDIVKLNSTGDKKKKGQ